MKTINHPKKIVSMLKQMKIKLLLLLIIITTSLFAHQDYYASFQKNNLYFQYSVGWEEMELNNKLKIFLHLADNLLKEKKTKEKIYINFTESNLDSAYCTVGFGNFTFEDYHTHHKSQHIGLKINIVNYDINIKELLNLVSGSVNNLRFIKSNQKHVIINLHYRLNGLDQYDTLTSIHSQIISTYKSAKDKLIEKLINKKTYSNLTGPQSFWNLDYYYQNNKFHFYNTSEPKTKYNPKTGKDDIVKTFGEDILIVDNVTETKGNWNHGHFVFTNDSTLYYIPKIKNGILGPFKLDSIYFGRPPVRNINYEHFGYDRFTLYFDNYYSITKALFIPEKKLLINNYHILEGKAIQNYIDSNDTPKREENKKNSLLLMILSFLAISLILNIWLIYKRKK